jgi:hypothetical protein
MDTGTTVAVTESDGNALSHYLGIQPLFDFRHFLPGDITATRRRQQRRTATAVRNTPVHLGSPVYLQTSWAAAGQAASASQGLDVYVTRSNSLEAWDFALGLSWLEPRPALSR